MTNEKSLQNKISELKIELKKWRELAEKDSLTGCLRRESFMSLINERRQFGLLPTHLTLAVVDLDHFKNINDTHGHLFGDKVLKEFSKNLQNSLPNGSLVCRMGGEEFVLLSPLSVSETVEILNQVKKSTVVPLGFLGQLVVTASIGVVSWKTDENILASVAAADGALYQAKQTGRSRVVIAA